MTVTADWACVVSMDGVRDTERRWVMQKVNIQNANRARPNGLALPELAVSRPGRIRASYYLMTSPGSVQTMLMFASQSQVSALSV